MSSTPNYGYNTRIDAIERIDRDIKRVEDKADRNSEIKVDKADGYGLISKNRLEQITHNQNHIECLSKRIDRADIDIADRYTKSEIKTKLRYKADKCELEKHMIDPQAHGELCDGKVDKLDGHGLISQEQLAQIEINKNDISRMYTQAEVDELLSTKVNVGSPVFYNLALQSGLSVYASMDAIYYKNDFDIVTVSGNFSAGAGVITNTMTIATLPIGFRPRIRQDRIVFATNASGANNIQYLCSLSFSTNGNIAISIPSSADVRWVNFEASFLVAT